MRLFVVSCCLYMCLSVAIGKDTGQIPPEAEKPPVDHRFLPFTDKLSLVHVPSPKVGCDFCLQENQCDKWDEKCAIRHPECEVKCGKLERVAGPACLTCIEKAGCQEWDEGCNNKAPHCKMFCLCGDHKDCGSCAKTRQCSWCAFSADSVLDHMSSCRYAADSDMAGCPPPAFFARYPNQCAAAIQFTKTGGKVAERFIKGAQDMFWSEDKRAKLLSKSGKAKYGPKIPAVYAPASVRQVESLAGVNYAPPALPASPLANVHSPAHDQYLKAAAVASLHLHSGMQQWQTLSEGPSDPVVEKKPQPPAHH